MGKPILYYDNLSPCARSVCLLIKFLDLDVEMRFVDLTKGEHVKPDFVKMNPTHAVPCLDDNGFILWESHAILPYLATVYDKDDKLCPKDPKKRAIIDRWLHFDNGILYNRTRDISEPLWRRASKVVSVEKAQRAEEAWKTLDELISREGGPFLAGDEVTIADMCCVCSVKAMEVFLGSSRNYPHITAWIERCSKALPGYKEINEDNNERYAEVIRNFLTG